MIARGVRGLAWARRGLPPQRGSISSCVGRSAVLVARILLNLRPRISGPWPAPPLLRSGQQVFLRANWPWLQVSFKVRKTEEVSDKGRSQMGFNEVTLS